MGLYKHPYDYNKDEDVVFGGWAIGLSIVAGLMGVVGGVYANFCLKDIFVAHGLKAEDIPIAHILVTSICGGFALGIGLLNLFAFARHHRIFPKFPQRTYKF